MSEPDACPDPDAEMLSRLAALDLAAAEKAHGKLMAADDAGEIADLGRTYQRLARSLRQTLALKAKLKRDSEASARAAAKDAPPRVGAHAAVRRARELRLGVGRVIWDEAEDAEEALDYEDALDHLITEEMLADGFGSEPLDDQVVRICLELGFPPETAERWRRLPDPPGHESSHAGTPPPSEPANDPDYHGSG